MNRLLRYMTASVIIGLGQLVAANIDIRLSNNNDYGTNDRGSYNIDASETSNGGVDGGIVVLITNGGIDNDYKVYVQYHTGNPADGNIWYSQPINTAGNTKIRTDAAGAATSFISHLAIKSSDDYQGDDYDGNVTWIVVNDDADDNDPATANSTQGGDQWLETYDFDLVAPVINTVGITAPKSAPWNQTFPHYAKNEDEIRLTFATDEAIETMSVTVYSSWQAAPQNLSSTAPYAILDAVTGMPENSSVTFSATLRDANGNGVTATDVNDGSSVITDFTPPILDNGTTNFVKIITTDDDYYAKSGDQVVLTIKANETLVQGNFDNNNATSEAAYMVFNVGQSNNVTVTPSLSGIAGNNSSEFSATVTINNDNETSNTNVDFSITGIYDRAGNETSITSNIPTIGSAVYYDSDNPSVETMEHVVPDNNNNPNPFRAKNGDAVKLSFSTSEVLDYNWDEDINNRPQVTFQGGAGNGNIFNSSTIASVGDLQNFTAELDNVSGLQDGELRFSLTYRDLSGNQANAYTALDDEATRITVDNSAPGLDALTIASSQAGNTTYARIGETVTITIDANEELRNLSKDGIGINGFDDGVAGTIGGLAATATLQGGTNGQVWILAAEMGQGHPEGLLEFALTITDMAGNQTALTQADLTGGTSVTFDKTAPTLSNVSIEATSQDEAYKAWAKDGSTIDLVFEANEDLIADPTVNIAGAAATRTALSGRTYTYRITVDDAVHEENDTGNPNANFTIDFTNNANIAGTQVTHNTAGVTGTVSVDYTAPTLEGVFIRSNNVVDTSYAKSGSVVTLKFAGADNLSEGLLRPGLVVEYDYLSGALSTTEVGDATNKNWTASAQMDATVTEQVLTFRVNGFQDLAGNTGTAVTAKTGGKNVTYDQTAPELSGLTMTSNNTNDRLSTTGNKITMLITVDQTVEANGIQIPVVTIANRSSADGDVTILDDLNVNAAENGNLVYNANYIMQDSDTETDSIEFQVAFSDLAGNAGTVVDELTTKQGVSFDKTAPDFTNQAIGSSIAIRSDNRNDNSLVTIGDNIIMTLTSAEALATGTKPSVNVLGSRADVVANVANTVFTVTYPVDGNEAGITNNQVVYFDIEAGYADPTGNTGNAVTQAVATFENATLVSTDGSYVLYDITPPVFDQVRIKSSNANDTTLAKAGDVITLTMVSDTPIKTATKPTISIANNAIPDGDITRVSNLKFTATYTMQDNANDNNYDDPTQKIPISITAYDDAAGNTGAAVNNTTNPTESFVVYDNTDPTLSQVSIVSNQDADDPTLAIPGSTVTLTFVADETIQEPTVTIGGRPPDNLAGTNTNKNWTATIVMLEDDNDAVDPVPFSITYSDLVGNAGTPLDQDDTNDGSSISFDKTKPTLSAIYFRSESTTSYDSSYANPNTNLGLRFKVSEPLAELDIYINNERGRFPAIPGDPVTITKIAAWNGTFELWKAAYTITDATDDNDGAGVVIPFTIDFTDLNAYGGTQVTETTDDSYVTFDKTPPTVDNFTYSSNNDNNLLSKEGNTITAELTVDELIQTPKIKIGGYDVTETVGATAISWSATHVLDADDTEGQIAINLVSFVDYAGNEGAARTTTTNGDYVTYDKTSPVLRTVSVASNNTYSSGTLAKEQDIVTITISTSDADNVGELISEPTVSMLGGAENVTVSPNTPNAIQDRTWTASKTVVSSTAETEAAFSITYTDLAGNAGAAAAEAILQDADGTNVTIDRTKTNVASLELDLTDASDSGVSNSDNLTKETKPTFSLTGLTGAPVSAATDSIYIVIGTDTTIRSKVNANEMTFTISADKELANQVAAYSATVVTRDLAGNLSDPSPAFEFRVDTQEPSPGNILNLIAENDMGFSDVDNRTNDRTPMLQVTALDPGKRHLIDVYYDAVTAGLNDQLAGSYRMSQAELDTFQIATSLNDDTYNFTYFVTDSAGNKSSESNVLALTIDSTASSAPDAPDLMDAFDKGTSNSDNLTNLSTFDLQVTSVTAGDSIHIKNAANNIVGRGKVELGQNTATVNIVGAATGDYFAYALDEAGNTSSASIGLTITVDQDPTDVDGLDVNGNTNFTDPGDIEPVVIDLDTDSDSGILDSDNLTNDITPSFTVSKLTATDSVFIYFSATDSLGEYVSVGTTQSLTIPSSKELSDNLYTFTVKTRDYAGNLSGASNPLVIKVDATAHTITSTPDLLLEDDTGIDATDNITNKRTPSFLFSQLPSVKDSLRLFVNNGVTNQFVIGGRKGLDKLKDTLTVPNVSRLDEGSYDFTYVIIDSAGNASDASAATTIRVDFTPPDAPTAPDLSAVDDSGVSDTDNLTKSATMNLTTTGFTAGDFGLLYKIDGTPDTTLVDSVISTDSGSLTYSITNDLEGVFNFYAIAQDTAGNRSDNSALENIEIDQTAPVTTGITIDLDDGSDTGIKNDDNLTNDATPVFTVSNVTSTDSVFLYFNETDSLGLKAADVSVGFTGNFSKDTTYIATVKSKDIAGNLSEPSPSLSFRIDTTPFVATEAPDLMSEFDTGISTSDDTTNSRVPQFEIKQLPAIADSLHLFVKSGINNELVYKTRKSYNVYKDTLEVPELSQLGTGNYIISYTVIDSAGNTSLPSPLDTIYIDFTPPNDPGLPLLESASDLGESESDNITNEDRIDITLVDILPGYSGVLYSITGDDTTRIDSSLLAPPEEKLTFNTSTFATGTYKYTSVHVDTAGNRSGYSEPITIEIDNVPPTAQISYGSVAGDSLVRAADLATLATFEFNESMDSVNVPTINIDYPEVDNLLDLTNQPLTRASGDTIWTFSIPLNTSGLEEIDGDITITVNAADVAGNPISASNITGLTALKVDNTPATFSNVNPGSQSFNNVLNNFGWTLSESIDTGWVVFNKLSDGTKLNIPLLGIERVAGDKDAGSFLSGDPVLSEESYDLVFTSIDTAGNTGRDTISSFTYDITSPEATVTFSELFASPEQKDTILVTFNEKVAPAPNILMDWPNAIALDLDDTMSLIDGGDSTVWFYEVTIPTHSSTNQGLIRSLTITATDLATNPIDSADVSMPDTLYIDGTEASAEFIYTNTSNSDLETLDVGIGGDVLRVTVRMNEPLSATDPLPTLNYTYGWEEGNEETGTVVTGLMPVETTNDDTVWVFDVTLSDSIKNDGHIKFDLIAEDRANNTVTTLRKNTDFRVDNFAPAEFATGVISVHGPNPVQGWITGITDSIGVQVPIQTNLEDSTLYKGGEVQLQFYNLNRGTGWVIPESPSTSLTIGDSIVEAGPAEQFYRRIGALYAVMPPGSDLMTGDSLAVRARIVDRHGNITIGTESLTRLAFDPTAPVIGAVAGGSFVSGDTLFSSDTVQIDWTDFTETDEDESGIDRYEVSILKLDTLYAGTDTASLFGTIIHGWDTLASNATTFRDGMFLEHNTPYVGHVRAFDVAGNISDTLVTDTILRYNSNPVITLLENASLNEDFFWTDTVKFTDLDLSVMQGDSFTFKAKTTRTIGDTATGSVAIDSIGALSWTPTQDDTGTYTIEIVIEDAYALTDTFQLPLMVNAVNDTPVFVIPSSGNDPYYIHQWEEDQSADTLVLSRYITDVDNNITTEIAWQAVILDTTQLDEDYPLGKVIVGPNTPWEVHAALNKQYLGFDPGSTTKGINSLSPETVRLINNTRTNPLISVDISVKEFEGVPDSVIAVFSSDSNYHGSNHRIIFIAQDNGGAVARDTIHASIQAQNDPPTIAKQMIDEVIEMWENDSIWMEFGQYVSDIDDSSLVFTIRSIIDPEVGNDNKVTIKPSVEYQGEIDSVSFNSHNIGDSVLFVPEKLWDDYVMIQLKVSDNFSADSTTFTLDVKHVERPKLAVSVLQQNAFTKFLQVIITDTSSKTTNLSMEVQNQPIQLDTIAPHTYSGHLSFEASGNYSIDIYANAHVGDTTLSEAFALAAGSAASRWSGRSYDGRFSVSGDPGTISYDQPFLIADSSLFEKHFYDRASYVLGSENFYFNNPVEVRFASDREDLAIYIRENGARWQELPSLTINNEIYTLSDQTGYFRLGPKTIIVPEQTSIHQNYPNPFNPTTTITYDIGLLDGLRQNVTINIYNLIGQKITTLVKDQDQIGQFKVQWDGYDKFGQQMSSGIYFVQLTTKTGIVKNKKMMLLK